MSRPLRLLILTDTAILGQGGSERFLRNLLANLPGDDFSADVIQFVSQPPASQCVARLEGRGIRLIYRPIEALYAPRGIAAYGFVRQQVQRGNYDIVQSHHEKSDLINALLPRVRGLRRISNRRDLGFQKSSRVHAVMRRANSRFDRIVAPSKAILDALVADENADAARCLAIPNGVDVERFLPASSSRRSQLRAALGFADGDCLIGCVASFTPVKRHAMLLDAFAQLHSERPECRLVLAGEGPMRADIETQARSLGVANAVHFLGARADVENVLPALDIFVLASSTEGMSNAILEAQSCGVPVVATDVGGNPEVIEHQVTGLLVPASQPPALALALRDLVAAPGRRAALGAAASRTIARDHSLAAMAAAYAGLYRDLACSEPPNAH
ncbi:MAG TPA: glycosyltransferase [Rudaea sp.]|nr:glycosyltransferase [Rudaea sp.]